MTRRKQRRNKAKKTKLTDSLRDADVRDASAERSDLRDANASPTSLAAASQSDAAKSPYAVVFFASVFLSAFLLFQVQPMISKAILPWFGGTPAVWTTCMLFFQVLLLLGYAAAHAAHRFIPPKGQFIAYVALVVTSLCLLPILPSDTWKPTGEEANPTWVILKLLAVCLGLPFFTLSMNSPLIQTWFYRFSGAQPYRLYALSNAGSLLGLLTYPFVVEPNLGTKSQGYVWAVLYAILVIMMSGCGYLASYLSANTAGPVEQSEANSSAAPTWRQLALWVALSACGSTLLLAMTNHITLNVAVVPFLWVAPLAIYLLTFILVFAQRPIYHRGACVTFTMVAMFACAWLYRFESIDNIAITLSLHLIALFAGCMLCHGELAMGKPDPKFLTLFFLAMSFGGAIGGIFTSLVAPKIFLDYLEYPLILATCWGIGLTVLYQSRPLAKGKPAWAWGLLICLFMAFLMLIRDGVIKSAFTNTLTHRDFYGVLSVRGEKVGDRNIIALLHGSTMHGRQNMDESQQFEPTAYYKRTGGLGAVMGYLAGRPNKRVGVLGMGIATIAAYAEAGDDYRFYEIDPNVIRIAQNTNIFTFWSLFEARGATAEVVLGDARISLERELARREQQAFDALILDVFSGDAIPAHLLTEQAMQVYLAHLKPDGIIAVHISNRHLDLLPVVKSLASKSDLRSAIAIEEDVSEWMILAKPDALERLVESQKEKVNIVPIRDSDEEVAWTDDFSDLWSILK